MIDTAHLVDAPPDYREVVELVLDGSLVIAHCARCTEPVDVTYEPCPTCGPAATELAS